MTRKEEITRNLKERGFECDYTDNKNEIIVRDKDMAPLCMINTRKRTIEFSLLNRGLDWSVHLVIAEAIGCLRCYD